VDLGGGLPVSADDYYLVIITFLSEYSRKEIVNLHCPPTTPQSQSWRYPFPMQEPISELVAKLREEIAQISEANRRYLQDGRRLAESESAHQRRAERLQEILNKLASLTDWKKE
jgi:hypothetical protein